jgi:hypothetical protein
MRTEALRKMLAQAPDKGKSKFLIPDMIDKLDKDLVDGSCGKDSSFRPAGGKYPFVAQKIDDRPKLAAGAKQASNGLHIGFKGRSPYPTTRSRAVR